MAVLAILPGITSSLIAFALYRQVDVAIVLGSAVAVATLSALLSGLLIPFIFRKMGIDPANASGPLGIIIQDAISVAIYFSIASAVL